MQRDRSEHPHDVLAREQTCSSVHGFGLCDALRVELQPCQIAGAIEELEERRGPLNEAFERARTRWDAVADEARSADSVAVEEELSRSAHALHVLSALRGQLPTAQHDAALTIVGPATTISELVAATARNAVDDLAELIRESPKTDERAQTKLREATAAVAAWVKTYIDCEALEWFTFDPEPGPKS
jgi:hypothetical protein